MKRKIALIGPSTLMVSLPSKWAKEFNLKKGDEIDLIQEGSKLIVSTENFVHNKTTELNLSSLKTMLYRVIGALYKKGYDEIKIKLETKEQVEAITDVLRRTCIGYEIIQQDDKLISIKEVSKIRYQEFDNILRRNFLSLILFSEESLNSLKKGDFNMLNESLKKERSVNKYSDYCRRILNKRAIEEFQKNSPLYVIVEQIEKISDIYDELCNYCLKNKLNLTEKILLFYEEVNEYLKEFYNLFYSFNLDNLEDFGIKKEILDRKMEGLIEKAEKQELKILFYLNNILNLVFDLNGSLMTYKL